MSEFFDDHFSKVPAMAILRGFSETETVEIAQRAWRIGLQLVEIPVQSRAALSTLEATVRAANSHRAVVGAGTVTTLERVRQAANAGAAFTVAPGLDLEIMKASLEAGMPHLPGVASATEVHLALKNGCTFLKAFPAYELGASWISAIHGPFPEAKFVATGGINMSNAESFLTAGAAAVSLGSVLADTEEESYLATLVERIRRKG